MLTFLVVHNKYVTDVWMEPIANIKCKIHQFHVKECFIYKKRYQMQTFMLGYLFLYFS